MGDSELKIEYTPEELKEIDRIVGVVSGKDIQQESPEEFVSPYPEAKIESYDDLNIGEPDDLNLPVGDFDGLVEKKAGKDVYDKEDMKDEGVEDITDFLEEVKEPETAEKLEDFKLDDLTSDLEKIPDEPMPEFEKEGFEDVVEPADKGTPLEQLDKLTSEEPESLDLKDLAQDDVYVDKGAQDETLPDIDIGEIDEIPAEKEIKKGEDKSISVGKDFDMDIPDLSDIPLKEAGEIPESEDYDVPDIDIDLEPEAGDVKSVDDVSHDAKDIELSEISGKDISDIEDIDDIPQKETPVSKLKSSDDLDQMMSGDESIEIEPLDDDQFQQASRDREPQTEESIELSDRELKKLKRSILLYNPAIRQAVKDTIINDLLPLRETRQLVDMIVSGKPEDNIHRFLEKKLNKKISLTKEKTTTGRRVISSRPEYTVEGKERQKKLFKLTAVFIIAALVAFLVTILSYQYIYKPYMAKKKIHEGVALILKSGDYTEKPKHYQNAEKLFRDVNRNYIEKYLYGYNAYARAYFDKKEYDDSLKKLNEAYEIDRGNIETLNNLGYFYSKVPGEFYNTKKRYIEGWYFQAQEPKAPEKVKKKSLFQRIIEFFAGKDKDASEKSTDEPVKIIEGPDREQLDVAIHFYRRVLLRDSKNVTALYGIGNAYFYQGHYIKAKKYFEDILKVDPNSAIGYSGLLNLYIERDSFSQVVSIHSDLRNRDMMHELPSPLLAKWASYYLDKRKTDRSNVRIDYGVQSPRFIDTNDNIYPAVYSVLMALNKRDADYPPLQLQFARLNKVQDNLKVMKLYLEKAEDLSRKYYNADYFAALHLLGEYYYTVREPVKAYEYLNKAIKAHGNQPSFTRDEFYKETENIGTSYALTGNIFYYFFDKIKARFGSLEDELIQDDSDQLANYIIARDKYEKALAEGYDSSELRYNLGRIYYLKKLYRDALDQWLHLYEDFVKHPELMFALGNAFYHMGDYEASKGEYLKLISFYEHDADSIRVAYESNNEHVKIFQTLASAYNNLGAIYQMQDREDKSNISYWKGIDYAQRISRENEFARVNLARAFKKKRVAGEPIIDESIPYSIEIYREEMRR